MSILRYFATGTLMLALLSATASVSFAQGSDPYELWVLDDTSRLYFIDPVSLIPSSTIVNLSTPSTAAPAACIAPSTVAGLPVEVFVGQGPLLRIVDVATKTARAPRINLATELGLTDLTIRSCDTAVTRGFQGATGLEHRSFLYLGVELPTGEARWVVVDQKNALNEQAPIVRSSGALELGANILDVQALETEFGNGFQRVLFSYGISAGGFDQIATAALELDKDLSVAPSLGKAKRIDLPTIGFPQNGLSLGSAFDRDFQVVPGWLDGSLRNFDTDFSCSFPWLFAHVSIVGVGPNSYSVFAAAPYSDLVALIDPNTCLMQSISVGDGPSAIVPRGRYFWDGLFVANEFSGDIGLIDVDLSYRSVHLSLAGDPIDMGMILQPSCSVNNLLLDRVSTGGDQIPDDIELNWVPQGCPQGKEVFVWCACSGFPGECPCDCDCSDPQVDPDCACPLIPPGSRGIQDVLVDFPPGDVPSLNPWKKLENTPSNLFNHENVPPGGTWFYLVTDSDLPPLVPGQAPHPPPARLPLP